MPVGKLKLKHILSDVDFALAKELKEKLREIEHENALVVLDYLRDELLYDKYYSGDKK